MRAGLRVEEDGGSVEDEQQVAEFVTSDHSGAACIIT